MYYIEEVDKLCNRFRKSFPKVRLKENVISIEGLCENEKKSIKIAKKIDKILKKTNSNKIVLSNKVKQNEVLKNMLYTYEYDITDGKWLFEGLSTKILDYIIEKKNIKKEECRLSILVNDLKDYTVQNIKEMSKEYKSLNIVTNHMEKFKKIEETIFEEDGIIITISNNKKKALTKSNIILNIDFPNELINKYNINDEAIIIDIQGNVRIKKKRFNGTIINDYKANINTEIIDSSIIKSLEKYNINEIYESTFYKKITYIDFKKKLKRDKCEIVRLYSINGII